MNPKLMAGLIGAVALSIIALAVSSIYSAYVSSQQHKNACNARAASADALDGLIAFVLTPKPGTTQTAAQIKATQTFQTAAMAIVDKQRC